MAYRNVLSRRLANALFYRPKSTLPLLETLVALLGFRYDPLMGPPRRCLGSVGRVAPSEGGGPAAAGHGTGTGGRGATPFTYYRFDTKIRGTT